MSIAWQTPATHITACRRPSLRWRVRASAEDIIDDFDRRPGFITSDDQPAAEAPAAAKQGGYRRKRNNLNDRLLTEISEIEAEMPLRESDVPQMERAPIGGYTNDLLDVNPFYAFSGSALAAGAAVGMWLLTGFLAQKFADSAPMADDFYVVQRIATVVRTCVVGASALASGVSGVTSVGLLLLSIRCAFGILTGEFESAKKGESS